MLLRLLPFIISVISLAWLTACQSNQVPPAVTAIVAEVKPTSSPTATLTPTPTATTTPSPTATSTATVTPSPTSSPTPTHPLMIEVMRQQRYPGSPLTIEQPLEAGSNYNRYLVSYQSENNKIFALLTVPKGNKPPSGWPIIIFNHGYIAPAQYRTTERYVGYVDGFARNGYIVLKSDYRGHGSSEGKAEGGYGSPDYTVDVLNGMVAVSRYPQADPNRIGMWGHSMGGQVTLRAMVVTKTIKAGVIWAGVVSDYPDLFRRTITETRRISTTYTFATPIGRRRWRQELEKIYGTPTQNPKFWASISPNNYLNDLAGPLQLHHGTADEEVPIASSKLLNTEMEQATRPIEFYIYEGDNHNLANNFNLAMERSIKFFDTYVKGKAGN